MRFHIETGAETDVIDVTDAVSDAVPADHDGSVTVFVPHTTAGVVVNEAERRLLDDVASFVASFARGRGGSAGSPAAESDAGPSGERDGRPDESGGTSRWRHDELDGNAASHLRALLLGASATVPVRAGEPALGTWQSILLVECDGPRIRSVDVVA